MVTSMSDVTWFLLLYWYKLHQCHTAWLKLNIPSFRSTVTIQCTHVQVVHNILEQLLSQFDSTDFLLTTKIQIFGLIEWIVYEILLSEQPTIVRQPDYHHHLKGSRKYLPSGSNENP